MSDISSHLDHNQVKIVTAFKIVKNIWVYYHRMSITQINRRKKDKTV